MIEDIVMSWFIKLINKTIDQSELPNDIKELIKIEIKNGLKNGESKLYKKYGIYAFDLKYHSLFNSFSLGLFNGNNFNKYVISYERGIILDKFRHCNESSIVEEGQFGLTGLIDEEARISNVNVLLKRLTLFNEMVSKTHPLRERFIGNAIACHVNFELKRSKEGFTICEEYRTSISDDVYCYEVEDRSSKMVRFWIDKDFKAGLSFAENLTIDEIPEEILSVIKKKTKIAQENGADISAISLEFQPQQAQGLSTIQGSNNTGETPAAPGEDGSEHDI